MTIKINEAHLGNEATRDEAHRVVKFLQLIGYDAEYGQPVFQDERADNVDEDDWTLALDSLLPGEG